MHEPLQTTTEIHVTGTDRFRQVALFGSMIACVLSLLLILMEPRSCEEVKLELGVYLCCGVQVLTFFLILASYLCQGCILKLGRAMVVCYFALVGLMVGVQVIFFHGEACNRVAPTLYYWLFVNIILFYILVAYGLSLWGAYICWEVDEEEKLI